MKIGLIIAIERELQSFLSNGDNIEECYVNNRKVYKTLLHGHDVYAIKSGFGIIDASSATQLLITKFDVEMVVNFGVAGAVKPGYKVSDLFVVTKSLNYDFDVSTVDDVKKYQYEDYDDEFIPMDNELIERVRRIKPDIKDAVVGSGGRFLVDTAHKIMLSDLGCNICDMEISGISRVCNICGVKCLSIKCISDTFEGDDSDFNTNVIASAKMAYNLLASVLPELN